VIARPTLAREFDTGASHVASLLIYLLSLVVIERREKIREVAIAGLTQRNCSPWRTSIPEASSSRTSSSVGNSTCSDENAAAAPPRAGCRRSSAASISAARVAPS
jgi:hypothetical protein